MMTVIVCEAFHQYLHYTVNRRHYDVDHRFPSLEGPHPTCSKCNCIIMFVIVGEALCSLMCVCVCHGSQSCEGPINPFKILNMHPLVRLTSLFLARWRNHKYFQLLGVIEIQQHASVCHHFCSSREISSVSKPSA